LRLQWAQARTLLRVADGARKLIAHHSSGHAMAKDNKSAQRSNSQAEGRGSKPRHPMWGCGPCGIDSNFCWKPTCRECGKEAPAKYRRIATEAARAGTTDGGKPQPKTAASAGGAKGGAHGKELRELKAENARLQKL
jgi:hypothetical protein